MRAHVHGSHKQAKREFYTLTCPYIHVRVRCIFYKIIWNPKIWKSETMNACRHRWGTVRVCIELSSTRTDGANQKPKTVKDGFFFVDCSPHRAHTLTDCTAQLRSTVDAKWTLPFFWILFMFIYRDRRECMNLSNVWMLCSVLSFRFFVLKFFSLHIYVIVALHCSDGRHPLHSLSSWFIFHKIQLKLKRVKRNAIEDGTASGIYVVRCTTDNNNNSKMEKGQ